MGQSRFTAAEKAEMVASYLIVKHGNKSAWLAERNLCSETMARWRRAYLFGDLDRGLIPRDTSQMSVSDGARLRQLELQLAAERQTREEEQARHRVEVERLQRMNEALGKAIGLLHDHAAQQEPTAGNSPRTRRRTIKSS